MVELSWKIDFHSLDAEKPRLAEFLAVNVLSNNANLTAISFEVGELSVVE
jgi:hypothetical protein